jgi:hypothetical protein
MSAGDGLAALSTAPLFVHKTGIQKDAEVPGDGWAAHLEMSCDRIHGSGGLGKEIEHQATRAMADRSKDIRAATGTCTMRPFRKRILTRQAQ